MYLLTYLLSNADNNSSTVAYWTIHWQIN